MDDDSPILLIPLCRGMSATTNGTALSKSTYDLQVPQLTNLLPRVAGLFVFGVTENVAAADFEWNVAMLIGFDRQHEAPTAVDIASVTFDATLSAGARSAEYTTVSNFMPHCRLQVWWRNKAGITGVKNGTMSAILGVHLQRT